VISDLAVQEELMGTALILHCNSAKGNSSRKYHP
jgi:hypothetical protein